MNTYNTREDKKLMMQVALTELRAFRRRFDTPYLHDELAIVWQALDKVEARAKHCNQVVDAS